MDTLVHSNIWDLHSSKGCIKMNPFSVDSQEKRDATFPYKKTGPNEMKGDSKRKQRWKTKFKT